MPLNNARNFFLIEFVKRTGFYCSLSSLMEMACELNFCVDISGSWLLHVDSTI